jgi:hypothetical protein
VGTAIFCEAQTLLVSPALCAVIPAKERVKELAFGPICDSLAEDLGGRE